MFSDNHKSHSRIENYVINPVLVLFVFICYCILWTIAGCSTTHNSEYLNASNVISADALPIDGTWAVQYAPERVFRIKNGKIYSESVTLSEKSAVVGKNIRKNSTVGYELLWYMGKRFGHRTAKIEVVNFGELRLCCYNSKTGKIEGYYGLDSLDLDDPFAHLSEWEAVRKGLITPHELAFAYNGFLDKYPDSTHSGTVLNKLDAIAAGAWEKAQRQDKVYEYESFLKIYFNSSFSDKARSRIDWQKENRAIIEIEYPEVLKMERRGIITGSGIKSEDVYIWDTVFKEVGGKAGFKLNRKTAYVKCNSVTFNLGVSGSWKYVETNSEITMDYWFTALCGGGDVYTATWDIEDDNGNKSNIIQTIRLR